MLLAVLLLGLLLLLLLRLLLLCLCAKVVHVSRLLQLWPTLMVWHVSRLLLRPCMCAVLVLSSGLAGCMMCTLSSVCAGR